MDNAPKIYETMLLINKIGKKNYNCFGNDAKKNIILLTFYPDFNCIWDGVKYFINKKDARGTSKNRTRENYSLSYPPPPPGDLPVASLFEAGLRTRTLERTKIFKIPYNYTEVKNEAFYKELKKGPFSQATMDKVNIKAIKKDQIPLFIEVMTETFQDDEVVATTRDQRFRNKAGFFTNGNYKLFNTRTSIKIRLSNDWVGQFVSNKKKGGYYNPQELPQDQALRFLLQLYYKKQDKYLTPKQSAKLLGNAFKLTKAKKKANTARRNKIKLVYYSSSSSSESESDDDDDDNTQITAFCRYWDFCDFWLPIDPLSVQGNPTKWEDLPAKVTRRWGGGRPASIVLCRMVKGQRFVPIYSA